MKRKMNQFIELDLHKCIACWECIDGCANHVIGKVNILWHKHIVLNKPDDCSGCMKCVRTCQHGVIRKKAES